MIKLDNIALVNNIDIQSVAPGTIQYYWLEIVRDGLGAPINVPVMIAKGMKPGPVLGLTAAVHGNELNGIPVIQRLFKEIESDDLSGTIIGVPVVNVPSYLRKKRRFIDGVDLNHIMPGKSTGTVSQVYTHNVIEKLVKKFDYLIDLHTASQGRINSYYIRADMDQQETKSLAMLQNADIIVHNPPSDGTLRGAADALNIPAITLEVGNPNTFQKRLIRSGIEGIHNVLCHLGMIQDEVELAEKETVICKRSYWLYTDQGGLLHVEANLLDNITNGQRIAYIRDVFGHRIKEYTAPEAGIVIGKSISPVNQTGGRILHLGIV